MPTRAELDYASGQLARDYDDAVNGCHHDGCGECTSCQLADEIAAAVEWVESRLFDA